MEPRPRALGCMRLSTATDRDEARAMAVLTGALDAGITLLDTADAYCHDARDAGHNERLVAAAVAGRPVRVATKGGMVRTGGRWTPNGRARHLEAACAASCERLGRPIDLYQLHVVDPTVSFDTSVRALGRLQDAGLVRAVGLCNVTAGQLARAADLVSIAAVQVELSPLRDDALRDGVLDFCVATGAWLLAWRPLGGPEGLRRLARDPVVAEVAAALTATPAEVLLAWLRDLSPVVVPLPGATRVETARSCGREVALPPDARARLDARFPAARLARAPRAARRPPDDAPGEVVVLMGIQGSGKSTRARAYEARGYLRLNRDDLGGRLSDLLPRLDAALAEGQRTVVLDNTYPTRAQRNRVIEVAWAHGVPARCEYVDISLEDAQVNAVRRMIAAHGDLPDAATLERASRSDPGTFGPRVQLAWDRAVEAPTPQEGWVRIDRPRFTRTPDAGATTRGLLLATAALWTDAAEGGLLPGVAAAVRAFDGVVGTIAWHPGPADGAAIEAALAARLGVPVDSGVCPHPGGPPACWCRPPLPGLGVRFIDRHRVDPARSVFVGASPTDHRLATLLGFTFVTVDAFRGHGT